MLFVIHRSVSFNWDGSHHIDDAVVLCDLQCMRTTEITPTGTLFLVHNKLVHIICMRRKCLEGCGYVSVLNKCFLNRKFFTKITSSHAWRHFF